ncbi:MAG TPA: glycoside hydrolase family 78 protein [Polyangiaceae bacterium]|nr:glycoside hydrolase family 78 protein [Polyangiaceae bacterium]
MTADLRVYGLRCEHLENPLAIDVKRPRLCWKIESSRRGVRQTAYEVECASSAELLAQGRADVWASGRVPSAQSVDVVWAGPALQSRQHVYWRVRIVDEAERASAWSEPAQFEMGLLGTGDWSAEWIAAPLVGGKYTTVPCPFLRKSFSLPLAVKKARLYVTALGVFEAYLNGQRIGRDELAPGWTDYEKRVPYHVYDVSSLLGAGENVIGALLGDGWYAGHVAMQGRQIWGDRPRFLAQLEIELTDGSVQRIVSDASFKYAFGPLVESDLIMGESYDARLELGGWSERQYDDSRFSLVAVLPDTGARRQARCSPPIRATEELLPTGEASELKSWPESRWVFDFGQNVVGRVRLKVKGAAGTTVRLRFAEMRQSNGELYLEALRSAKQTDYYTLKGDGEEVFEPRFTFHGFRFAELKGYPGKPPRDALTAVVLHSDLEKTGEFSCSEPLLNQLQSNIEWGQRGNFLDVPTDCPQRDERLGWTGDAQVFARTAAFNRNVQGFFSKWARDLADGQSQEGAFPAVAPHTNYFPSDGGPAWADASVICPHTMYLAYGDTRILEEHYERLGRFIDYLERTSQGLVRPILDGGKGWDWGGYGDWLSHNAETPKNLIGTAFFAHSTRLLAKAAAVLGKHEDAAKYSALAERVGAAFVRHFVTPDGLVLGHTQTAYVLSLHFDLLPSELRPKALHALISDIKARGNHLSTGFVGTPYLLHVLAREGELELAYALLEQRTFPSWLYPVTQGATTIWERWDGFTHDKGFQDAGMNSFNHYAYGAVGSFMYQVVAGIDVDEAEPGYRHIVLRPQPGGSLSAARASLESPFGRIESAWRRGEQRFEWQCTVPPNARATAHVPARAEASIFEGGKPAEQQPGIKLVRRQNDAAVYELGSGRYDWLVT